MIKKIWIFEREKYERKEGRKEEKERLCKEKRIRRNEHLK